MKNIFFYKTIIGEIGIADNGKSITNIYLRDKVKIENRIKNNEYKTEIIEEEDKTIINIHNINPLEREMSK